MVRINFSRFGYWFVSFKLIFSLIAGIQIATAQNNTLSPFFQAERWGYVNSRIEWVIQPQFLSASPFQQDVAIVKIESDGSNSWQLLLINGKFLLEEPAEHIQILGNKLFAIWKDQHMGIFNASYGWVFQPKFTNSPEEETQLNNGLLCARTASGMGITSLSGEWILQPQHEFVVIHSGQIAEVTTNGVTSLFHLGSSQIITDSVESVGRFACNRLPVRKNKLWGVLDNNGNWIQKPAYKQLFTYSENLAAALFQGNWGFLDTSGTWAIQPKYQLVRSFSEGSAAVRSQEKWGFVNHNDEWIIEPTYAEAFSFREKLALVKFQKKWYFLNPNGFTPIQLHENPNESALNPSSGFHESFFLFQNENSKYQFLTKTGSLLVLDEFDYAEPFFNGLALIRIENQNYYLTNKGIVLR